MGSANSVDSVRAEKVHTPIKPQLWVIRPEDCSNGWRVWKLALIGIKRILAAGRDAQKAIAISLEEWEPERTDPQRKTFWMWHGQVASELSIRTRMRWTKDDVHEVVFLERFMPRKEYMDLEAGELKSRPLRTSEAKKSDISEAMTKYLVWAIEQGIELTIPEERW